MEQFQIYCTPEQTKKAYELGAPIGKCVKDNKVVPNADLYKWHNVLTGSCEFGRRQFAKDHNIDIEHDSMTVREFVDLTKNAFGGEIIKQLKSKYNI